MSGFAVIVREHDAPADPSLVASVRRSLDLRGPHPTILRSEDDITFLSCGAASPAREPGFELEGRVVLFEGRLHGREELVRSLRARGREVTVTANDSELVAHAFAAWKADAPEHLLGDFSFVIWDRRLCELVCVRDRFGVRPLYHARSAGSLLVTNDLPTLLAIPDLAAQLHEPAIADFLLFAGNQDRSRTSFAAIHRVPPAHWMAVAGMGEPRVVRYWSLPSPAAPRRISEADAQEEFRSILFEAVRDRVRGAPAAISLSGGLDSNAIAVAAARAGATDLRAVTAGYEKMFADEERSYASQSAAALGIPWEFQAADDYALFERWEDPHCRGLEPTDTPMRAAFVDLMARLAAHGSTLLTGQGGDSVLYTSHRYFVDLVKRGALLRAAREALSYAMRRRRRPPLQFRSHALRALGLRPEEPPFPTWIREDFARSQDLRERWRGFWSWRSESLHPWRPEAALFTQQPMWANAFESYDFGWTGSHLDLTVPFLDSRLVEFLFTLPPMPHFADKDILRQSMRGSLPERIRTRAKAPLASDPVQTLIRQATPGRRGAQLQLLSPYAEPRILQAVLEREIRMGLRIDQEIPAICLAEWLSFR